MTVEYSLSNPEFGEDLIVDQHISETLFTANCLVKVKKNNLVNLTVLSTSEKPRRLRSLSIFAGLSSSVFYDVCSSYSDIFHLANDLLSSTDAIHIWNHMESVHHLINLSMLNLINFLIYRSKKLTLK